MSWLENNPVGVTLASASGLLILVSAALGYVWSQPADSGVEVIAAAPDAGAQAQPLTSDIGPISQYREFTDRPVFDQSRKPAVNIEGEGQDELMEAVADAPEVKLTGVVITPESKLVTLKPESNAESVIVYEGKPLEGEYTGWSVSEIRPRSVVLASRDGESLELDLQVNTRRMEEPEQPEPVADVAQGAAAEESGDQPLTRAEEIRQRIAERREELRRQSEEREADSAARPVSTSSYQSTIQNLIDRKRRNEQEKEKEEKNHDDGSDD
jgi:hypothetical protein